ncbi:hypothetical protein ACFLRF_02285 [Candidatus Altiarchaeota archaeon]
MSRIFFAIGLALILLAFPVHLAKGFYISNNVVSDVGSPAESGFIPEENMYLVSVFNVMTLLFILVGIIFIICAVIVE